MRKLFLLILFYSSSSFSQSVGCYYSSNKMVGIDATFGKKFVYGVGMSISTYNFTYPDVIYPDPNIYKSSVFMRGGIGINILNSTIIMGTFGMGVSDSRMAATTLPGSRGYPTYYYRSNLHSPYYGILIQQRILNKFCLQGVWNTIDGIGCGFGFFYNFEKKR